MSTIVNPSIFKFLDDLKQNNTREWFAKNKDYYLEEEEIKDFFTSINEGLSAIDNIAGMKVYRIYRDIRFSKDKTPYKIYRSCGYKRAAEGFKRRLPFRDYSWRFILSGRILATEQRGSIQNKEGV